MITIESQPNTSSGLPAFRQHSLADAIDIIVNDSPLGNQFAADSDSGEEFDTQAELSFNPSDATDSNPTRSLLASCTSSFQLHCAWADLISLSAGLL